MNTSLHFDLKSFHHLDQTSHFISLIFNTKNPSLKKKHSIQTSETWVATSLRSSAINHLLLSTLTAAASLPSPGVAASFPYLATRHDQKHES
jgi:hypothetical protein